MVLEIASDCLASRTVPNQSEHHISYASLLECVLRVCWLLIDHEAGSELDNIYFNLRQFFRVLITIGNSLSQVSD